MHYIPYVNVKMGTKSVPRRSNGNTLPLTQYPFGMASFCPQTDGGTGWFYQPDHEYAEGIRLTHQPSPWINDYGTVLMVPQNDIVASRSDIAWSGVRLQDTVLRPDYLSLTFLRSSCRFELTPTERCAALRLTFGDDRPSYLSFLPVKGNYTYRYDAATATLYGSTDGHTMDTAVDFRMHFVVRFDPAEVDAERTYSEGEGSSACLHIALTGRTLEARMGLSYISEEMALAALDRECGDRSFDTIRQLAEDVWEEKLGRIAIESHDEEQKKTFYSCLYRVFLFPRKAYELDADDKPVHYSPCDGKTRPGVRYTDNGFWDTYRTVYPLYTLIARKEFAEMLDGFVNDYLEGGWLPRWLSIGEVGCMPSTLIDAVIAEAAVNGIGSRETLENALQGMLHHANHAAPEFRYGRNGILSYRKYGYVPREEERESVNLTLDFAYGDWCIAQVARVLGHEDIVEEYSRRALNYRNLFDPESGFMRGRDKEGKTTDFFDPVSWGGEYTEGSAWQSSFAVPHDVGGLASLYGGRDKLIEKLDALFAEPPRYRVFGYGAEIHEMTEMALIDFGQMAISNQPSFHLPFLFAALGEQEKTNYWVERLAKETFSATDDGYPGDEDNGTTSAWYILATLGLYRLCPSSTEWIRCKRLVPSIKILGKDF
ncbi:MAG: GH92 family glycosyl hydrolase [Clostridia bacterium]|nr:GH92 family glycosyl hydrolase [Clostridia bacterium]